jgi:hypothetical protein
MLASLCPKHGKRAPGTSDAERLTSYRVLETAPKAVKDAEGAQLQEMRDGLRTATYRVAGRRGPAATVAWDPTRIADPQAALTRLLGAGVTVDWQPDPPPSRRPMPLRPQDLYDLFFIDRAARARAFPPPTTDPAALSAELCLLELR